MSEPFADEARGILRDEIARCVMEPSQAKLVAVVLGCGAVSVGLVAWQMLGVLEPGVGPALGLGAGAALGFGVVLGIPWLGLRRARARVAAEVDAVRARAVSAACPRCGASLEAGRAAGRRRCAACRAELLEVDGVRIVAAGSPALRRARWQAAVRHQLRHVRRPTGLGALGGFAIVGLALSLLTGSARLAGASALPMPLLDTALGDSEEEAPREGTARARGDDGANAGLATRPNAPAWIGTQALARRDGGVWHQLAAIVRVRDGRALVVFADGDVAWVRADGLLAPELAVGDAVEHWDGDAYVAGEVEDRKGPALLVSGRWTSASRVRVRLDAAHARGVGRLSELTVDDWIEVATADGWRPGVRVDAEGLSQRVVSSDGVERWVDHERVRGQRIGPGTPVEVDGRPGRFLVAARVGHALAVVDERGARRWTALSRVRRP